MESDSSPKNDQRKDLQKHNDFFKGFSKLSREERFQRLLEMGALNSSEISFLRGGGLKDSVLAENFIENAAIAIAE